MTYEDFVILTRQETELISILLHVDEAWATSPEISQALCAAERLNAVASAEVDKADE